MCLPPEMCLRRNTGVSQVAATHAFPQVKVTVPSVLLIPPCPYKPAELTRILCPANCI